MTKPRRPGTQIQSQRPQHTFPSIARSATPAVQMVAPAPEEGSGEGEATPLMSKESDNGESYKAIQDDATISQGDIKIAVRVAQASETFTGQCFRWNRSDIASMMRSVRCTTLNF